MTDMLGNLLYDHGLFKGPCTKCFVDDLIDSLAKQYIIRPNYDYSLLIITGIIEHQIQGGGIIE